MITLTHNAWAFSIQSQTINTIKVPETIMIVSGYIIV
ncbi:hypothetical protein SERP1929 [Staphylococcus epidermidis RP62A]|uniref:Uncharacterized protein n=1 Tax=Staphylococcus epidermidis (strain ATCC 35984 / DSM 28319 / BCRC 17069 / CCUG 31568 / BM 3577 / RP62A) TaxID=176279 RepID=Q5HLQ4_STAEQ|nr:hypothetical protein SERP1929 [Staphylococcus epidermidis RP62A]EES57212.1 hypothetical protein HMPREF0789_2237 [Staphylococcus epidermidis BCM-HMP0060]